MKLSTHGKPLIWGAARSHSERPSILMPPTVSVIVPCFNEQSTIGGLLEALSAQTYSHEHLEVVIADGLSTDRTREVVADFRTDHPDLELRLVDNPKRTIPAALNTGIAHATGEIIARLDAHSVPAPDYVAQVVDALSAGKGDNVGGVWDIQAGSNSWVAKSIAAAAANPLGAGDAQYRLKPRAGPVDTVPFGSFRRSLLDQIGAFDESLLSNEDYEFNARLRKAGGAVWLDPKIRSIYFARPTLGELARQYWRYGFWKWRMLRRYPGTLRLRQALPPLFAASLLLMSVLSLSLRVVRSLLAIEVALYCVILLTAGLYQAAAQKKPFLIIGLPAAVAVMHISWAFGFLWSMLTGYDPFGRHG